MSTHHARFLEDRGRQRRQAERLMLIGAGLLIAGLFMLVGGNVLVGTLHLSPRDLAYAWSIFPGVAVLLFGGLLSFFSMMAFLAS